MAITRRTFSAPAEMPKDTPGESAGEPIETGAADVTLDPETPLGKARSALAETDAELARLAAERDAALLRDDDAEAVRLDGEVEKLQRLRRAHVDKVALREREAERAAAEARAAARSETIASVELLLGERDRVGAELSAGIEASDKAFTRLIELGREIRAKWQFAPHDANPAMLTENSLSLAIPHEFYRLTARPHPLGGRLVVDSLPSFPAASKAEKFEDAGLPSKIKSLSEKLAIGSTLASRVMREGFSTNQLSVIPTSTPSTADNSAVASNIGPLPQTSPIKAQPDPELARLLARQNQLVNGPMDAAADAEYELLSAQIRARSA
jgi:hypothetical protein